MTKPYNIVGRQIEFDNAWYLHGPDADGNDIITRNPTEDGVDGEPLTVEFIGRTMVDLSSKPIRKDDDPIEYARVVQRIKYCLTVRSLIKDDIPDAELEAIWDALDVELDYDTRSPRPGEADYNQRIFVVPAEGALADKVALFEDAPVEPGFEPPLSYSLDRNVMANYFARFIDQAIDSVAGQNPTGTLLDTKDDLKQAVRDRLLVTKDTTPGQTPLDQKKVEILTKPATAFYRAVGIYITQMCD